MREGNVFKLVSESMIVANDMNVEMQFDFDRLFKEGYEVYDDMFVEICYDQVNSYYVVNYRQLFIKNVKDVKGVKGF